MSLADVLSKAGDIADDCAPAIVVGEIPQSPMFGRFAMTALVVGIQSKAGITQGFAQVGLAAAVFSHAMSQQDYGLGRACRQPLVNEKTTAVIRAKPKSLRDHGVSFICCRSSV